MNKQLSVFTAVVLSSSLSFSDINFTGFGSVVGGKVLDGDGVPQFGLEPTFLADYPSVSAYSEDLSFKPESVFGLQAKVNMTDKLSATAQIVARGANNYDANFDWAYVSYELGDRWTIQAGRKRLPLFYYSDFFDVGYAYVWVRPPADLYTWQIFNYDGVNLVYRGSWNDWSFIANVYAGVEDDPDNKLLGEFFFREKTREIWKDIIGGVLTVSNDWLEVRTTYMQFTNERYRSDVQFLFDGSTTRDSHFIGLAINAEFDQWFVLSEFNSLELGSDAEFDTAMLTFGYTIDLFTPFIGHSKFDSNGTDGEQHNTTFVGLRWDFDTSAALKIQWDKVDDKSFNLAVAGDSEALTIAIDFVF